VDHEPFRGNQSQRQPKHGKHQALRRAERTTSRIEQERAQPHNYDPPGRDQSRPQDRNVPQLMPRHRCDPL
jgi:hypothetical protein